MWITWHGVTAQPMPSCTRNPGVRSRGPAGGDVMRVLITGASGVIGRQLVPFLAAAGHEVTGLSRSQPVIPGFSWVTADALDQARRSPRRCASPRRRRSSTCSPRSRRRSIPGTWPGTSSSPTDCGPRAPGISTTRPAPRAPGGSWPRGWPMPTTRAETRSRTRTTRCGNSPGQFAPVLSALRELERMTTGAGGLVLRFGHLYGPGSASARTGRSPPGPGREGTGRGERHGGLLHPRP